MQEIYLYTPKEAFGSNCYLLRVDDEYAVIDPSVSFDEIAKNHPDIFGKVRYILITHAHFDHILAINSWKDKCGECIVGKDDAPVLSNAYLNCYLGFLGIVDGYFGEYKTVKEGDELPIGNGSITVIDCPGHTPGGVAYKIGNDIFVGDTLFAEGGYGRCDLPGGDIDKLEKSLIKLITKEKNEAVFYPGHGRRTTLIETIKYFT